MDSRKEFLLSRYVAGELSPEEGEELDLACLADPSLRETLRALDALRTGVPAGLSVTDEQMAMDRGLSKLRSVMNVKHDHVLPENKSVVRRMSSFIRIAAASVVGILIAGGIWKYRQAEVSPEAPARVQIQQLARFGTRSYLILPDSSKLWLNAGSKVSYDDGFGKENRELRLEGEAYFDIKGDPSNPFIIHTGKVDVKVLGTSLNVKAFPGDSAVETTLIRGKVQVDYGDRHVMLQPSEKVTIALKERKDEPAVKARDQAVMVRETVRPDSLYKTLLETSWVEDRLVFRNESFESVAEKLERWYNIKIHFENDRYRNVSMSGNFKDQSVETVMDALRISLGFHYRVAGDSISIW